MTKSDFIHIISEVKAEVIRFSPYRLTLVGPHKIQKVLFADACASAIFISGQNNKPKGSIQKERDRTISARDNKKNQTQINEDIMADEVRRNEEEEVMRGIVSIDETLAH